MTGKLTGRRPETTPNMHTASVPLRGQLPVTRVLNDDRHILGWGLKDGLGLVADAILKLPERHREAHRVVDILDIGIHLDGSDAVGGEVELNRQRIPRPHVVAYGDPCAPAVDRLHGDLFGVLGLLNEDRVRWQI